MSVLDELTPIEVVLARRALFNKFAPEYDKLMMQKIELESEIELDAALGLVTTMRQQLLEKIEAATRKLPTTP